MNTSKYISQSFLYALGTFIYVLIIAALFYNGQAIFGPTSSFFIPVFMLLLFIVSATITGSLVLGKPILLYLNNQKKEAITLLVSTLAWLVLFLIIVALVLLAR